MTTRLYWGFLFGMGLVTVLAAGAALVVSVARDEAPVAGVCGVWVGVAATKIVVDLARWRKQRRR